MFSSKTEPKATQQSILYNTPIELLFLIFLFLDVKSLGRIAKVCKLFQELSSKNLIWKQQFINRNAELPTSPMVIKEYYLKECYKSKFWSPRIKSPISTTGEESLKILLLGTSGSKKAEVVSRLADDGDKVFKNSVDFRIKHLNIDGKNVKLQVWDMVGQERFLAIATAYFRGAKGVFLTFNYSKSNTFTALKKQLQDASSFFPQDCKIMILGVKEDERSTIEVEHSDVMTFAQEKNLEIQNVTLINKDEVEKAFESMTRQILSINQETVVEKKTEDPKKTCCVM